MSRKHKPAEELVERVGELSRQLDSIYTALVIRDPGTPISAETYEGLRRQIIAGAQERLAHLVQLTEFDVAIRSGADVATLGRLVESWMAQAGVDVVLEAGDDLRFEGVSGDGPWEVALPAYVDTATSRTIRQGRLQKSAVAGEADREPDHSGLAQSDQENVGQEPQPSAEEQPPEGEQS